MGDGDRQPTPPTARSPHPVTTAHVVELFPAPTVPIALGAVAEWPGVVLFDSAARLGRLGRYSFLSADPFEQIEIDRVVFGDDPFESVRAASEQFRGEPIVGLPPFQGGVAGVLSYELGRAWERFPRSDVDEFALPDLSVGLYDWVLAWDHDQERCWLISQGWPETDSSEKQQRARARATAVESRIRSCVATQRSRTASDTHSATNPSPVDAASDFTRPEYLEAVRQAVEYVHAGDVFQVNLSQRLLFDVTEPTLELYERLRRVNPAPFAGLYHGDDWSVLSASPERFLQVAGREVETRPIKGTRKRQVRAEADLFGRDVLGQSEKDRAENVMIVDLLRNDLSRVCEPGSIRVPELCSIESYETVTHLVSAVRGRLREECDVWDLLAATFPGGSITGAPKPRAMEIIAELERTARGPYCGSLFYAGFDGSFDSSILIRTFVERHGRLQCRVGGGITAQSNPAAEFEETLAKAAGMIDALPRSADPQPRSETPAAASRTDVVNW